MVNEEIKEAEVRLIDEEGPAHNKTFTTEVVIDGIVYGRGVGSSKKEAEQEAAKQALMKQAKITKQGDRYVCSEFEK